jgi:hypothetical protein
MPPSKRKTKPVADERVAPAGLEPLIKLLRANGVLEFEGYGLRLALAPTEQPTVTLEFTREEKEEEAPARGDLYSSPALWGRGGPPDFE